MVSIARKNLFEDIPRFLVAQAGIMFAVSLVTIQTGVFNGVIRSTVTLVENSRADIWLASDKMVHLELTQQLLFDYAVRARKVDGVKRAEALLQGSARWNVPNGKLNVVKVFGFPPTGQLFVPGEMVEGDVKSLRNPYTVIVDQSNLKSLKVKQIGDTAQVGSLPVQVVGFTQNTQSVVSSSVLFTSLETANAYANASVTTNVNCTWVGEELQCRNVYQKDTNAQKQQSANEPPPTLSLNTPISYVLIQAQPGENIPQLKKRLEATFPETKAYTTAELSQKIRVFWQQSTGIGFILGLGAAVGIVVGVVIVGQILYSAVADHLKEFGTLKAMGASNRVIYGIIIEQALWMAILGYIPGMLLCWGLGAWTLATQGIVILITPFTAVGVFGVTVLMCVGSALFAIQKVSKVDPAIVFKA
ncbi:ABC transporter permease [Plectonema cf. radiosum LEGE 06105]|uniref:ABC transporter permease n=1 Tax=Plectonema cf. radiosum LEGE 06105 TaxID=945769 RepID=A0A8J7F8C2_9CYAN|nr:FtsX-like permease family protein [Plectonema radiosum]MBE9211253.1 ABC transporter permease [Plectonema cf. radiosum LEGE 06105]